MHAALARLSPEERTVIHAAAIALGQVRVRLTDRRMLILFVLLVALVVGSFQIQSNNRRTDDHRFDRFSKRTDENCASIQAGVDKINRFYDKQAALVAKRPDLSDTVKRQTIANYESSKIKALNCSGQS